VGKVYKALILLYNKILKRRVFMSYVVRDFNNVGEFMKFLDEEIAQYRRVLGELLKKLEELRVRAEYEKKIRSTLAKLGLPETSPTNEISLRSVKIIVNPSASQELSSLESAIEALNNKLTQLTAIRKEVEVLGGVDVDVKLSVVYMDGLPKLIILRI
jgi:flagellar biosynthesis chaperone FliJ